MLRTGMYEKKGKNSGIVLKNINSNLINVAFRIFVNRACYQELIYHTKPYKHFLQSQLLFYFSKLNLEISSENAKFYRSNGLFTIGLNFQKGKCCVCVCKRVSVHMIIRIVYVYIIWLTYQFRQTESKTSAYGM